MKARIENLLQNPKIANINSIIAIFLSIISFCIASSVCKNYTESNIASEKTVIIESNKENSEIIKTLSSESGSVNIQKEENENQTNQINQVNQTNSTEKASTQVIEEKKPKQENIVKNEIKPKNTFKATPKSNVIGNITQVKVGSKNKTFSIQIGAFKNKDHAKSYCQKMKTYVKNENQCNIKEFGGIHRSIIENFKSKESAEQACTKIKQSGSSCILISKN